MYHDTLRLSRRERAWIAAHWPRHYGSCRCPADAGADLWRRPLVGCRQQHYAHNLSRRLSRLESLAKEKGSFPYLEWNKYLQSAFIQRLPEDIQKGIAKQGIRNSHVVAIAPTGTISLLAGNISSGLEPIFAGCHTRKVLDEDGAPKDFTLTDYALDLWREAAGTETGKPRGFVTAAELSVRAHPEMQAALQSFVDNSISKTINVPEDYPFEEFKRIYEVAYDKGLKGCTTFRPNPITGTVLSEAASAEAPHCCVPEREAD